MQFFDTATIYLAVLPQDGAEDAGYMCPMNSSGSSGAPPGAVGEPVNVTNGNMWLEQTDYVLPGIGENIEINRFYNSIIQTSGHFGLGWSTKYDESLWIYAEDAQGRQMLRLNMPDGRASYFGRNNSTEPYKAALMGIYGQVVKNTDNTFTLTFKDGRIHKFSSTGKLLWQKDRNGNQTTLGYNASGHLTSVIDAFNRTLTITPHNVDSSHSHFGLVQSISDSIGTVATYEYFENTRQLKTVTYNDGSKYKFEYTNPINGKIYLATVKDALDNILETHAYDSQGRATTSEKSPVAVNTQGIEKYTLDYSHWSDSAPYTQVTDGLGRVTKYFFDKSKGRNLITKTEGVCSCGGSGSEVTTYEYDMALNLKKKTDALNQQTLYTYDSNGNRLTMTDVLGTETYTYNSFGQILTKTDRMNGVTTNTYNASGNLLTSTDALSNTTTLTYTSLGQLETITDARNHTTTLDYDTQGRLTEVEDADGKITEYDYDTRARLTSVTNALNETTEFEYDLNNRLEKVIHPDTEFMTYDYDLAGRMTEMTDERGNTTDYDYDEAYRLISVTDALNHTTNYEYDLMSNLTSQTDALGNTTNYEYDDFNRLKKMIYPPATTGATRLEERLEYNAIGKITKRIDTANRETLYGYDTAHRLEEITDAMGWMTQFDYNPRSQMTKVTDALNQEYVFTYDALGRQLTQTRAGTTMSYQYDAVGNRTQRTDYMGKVTNYVYDNLNRLTNINYVNQSSINATYDYDDLSRLISAVNNTGTITFSYDDRNRIDSTTDVFGQTVSYVYDENGNRTELKLNNVAHTNYVYDDANRLTQMTDAESGNYVFGYDTANRLTSRSLPNNVQTTYSYDGMSRLTRLLHEDGSNNSLFDFQYAYNEANQIGQIADLIETKDFTYDDVNRLLESTGGNIEELYEYDEVGNRNFSQSNGDYGYQPFNRLMTTDTAFYSHDANGNMLDKTEGLINLTEYLWDEENRLRQVNKSTGKIFYEYDALGRRTKRQINQGATTKFTYDGLDVVKDDDTISGITKYQNGLGIDNKLKSISGGTPSYFLQDHLGSTVGLADVDGRVLEETSYDSFGNATNPLSTRYQYTGREYDNHTGLHYYRARWYDAQIGRFISEDPIGFEGGDVNLYGYVKNKPLKYRDPRGLDDADREWEERYKPKTPDRNPWYWSHNESADNEGIPNYSGEPMRNPTLGIEVGANFHLGFFGYGGSYGVDRNLANGQTCVFRKWSMRTGLGLFAGAGLKGSFGNGPDRQISGATTEFEEYNLDVGDGLAGKLGLGATDSFSSAGNDFGVGVGPGAGLSGGVDWGQRTNIWCSCTP